MEKRISRLSFTLGILLVSLSLGAPLLTTSVSAQDESWQLIRAQYGYREAQVDVTALMRDLIARGGYNGRIAVSNQTMGGDPAVGKDKTLHMIARNRRGEEREFNFREGSFVDASMFAVRGDDRRDRGQGFDDRDRDRGRDNDRDRGGDNDRDRDLYIIRAYYGIQGRTVNVTDLVRSRVREGRLWVDVSNENMGGDPAVGANKVLIVIYRFRGEEQATAVPEGNRLMIP